MATDETMPNIGYNSCFNSKNSYLISSRKQDTMSQDFRDFLSPSQQSRCPNILRMVKNLAELANGPLCMCPYYDSAFAFGFYFAIIYGRKIKQHSMVHNLRYKTMLNKSCIYI